jgi:hypothetical protein
VVGGKRQSEVEVGVRVPAVWLHTASVDRLRQTNIIRNCKSVCRVYKGWEKKETMYQYSRFYNTYLKVIYSTLMQKECLTIDIQSLVHPNALFHPPLRLMMGGADAQARRVVEVMLGGGMI